MTKPPQQTESLPENYTQKDLENAAEDARYLMSNSPIIPKLLAVDIAARQLFLRAYGAIVSEVSQGWDVEYPELVTRALGMAAQEEAVKESVSALELHQKMFELVVPVLEIFIEMESAGNDQSNDQESDPDSKSGGPLPGGDFGDAAGMGGILRPAGGDEEHQAGEPGEGDCEEEAGA